MTKQQKHSAFFKHDKGHGSSSRTKMYGEYINKKVNGHIDKELDFETYCKQLIIKANAEINR